MRNKKLVKMTAMAATAAMMMTVAAGCGNSGSDTSDKKEDAAASKGGSTITIAASAGWVKDIDKELAAKYEEESGNTIEWQVSPDDQYENVLNSKLSVGEGADIFYIRSGVTINKYQPEKYMLDMSDQEWVSRYTDWAKEGVSNDGKIVQFQTWSVDGWGILYNKDIFKEAGITEVPKDYESFKAACDKVLAAGKTPIYEPGAAQWHLGTWLGGMTTQEEAENEGFYAGLNENSEVFAGKEGLAKSLDQMAELEKAGYFGKDFMANTWEDMVAKMASGDYAMGVVYTTFPAEVEAVNPEMTQDTWGMFPIPLNDNKEFGVSAGGIGRCVNKDTEVADAVMDYFEFLSQPENLTAYYEARKDLGPCSFTDIPGNVPAAYEDVINNASGTGFTAEDGVLYWDNAQVGNLMQGMFLGNSSAEDVLKGIDDLRQPSFGK
ncbi:carbohydrate ABC transporter substrate-binding protein [Faecalicatena contorta]|uniref:ABC transporter substrate-binding protein n=1 Tax=Faecalicatena contorta TaxID=39482 RepID=UPI00129EF6F2|nr:ABC transporter substrate-binding protein [Faecalicatena contorta]MRM90019.1 carbohydrate ABC transporter substrate-binding protein [Faecalicatena contorta]